jgi:hypothetical protein
LNVASDDSLAEEDEETRKTVQAYNKLLNSRGTLRQSSKAARDPEDALKRLANLILVNGIPAKAVRPPFLVLN